MNITDQHIYIGIIAVGVLSAIASVFVFRGIFAAGSWRSADGLITESKLGMSTDGRLLNDAVSHDSPMYFPDVEYIFTVAGRKLLGKDIAFQATHTSNKKSVQRLLMKYGKGRRVKVYYHPRRPDQCVLDRAVPTLPLISTLVLILGTVGFGVFGLLGFVPPII